MSKFVTDFILMVGVPALFFMVYTIKPALFRQRRKTVSGILIAWLIFSIVGTMFLAGCSSSAPQTEKPKQQSEDWYKEPSPAKKDQGPGFIHQERKKGGN
jgi:hypothetical protein